MSNVSEKTLVYEGEHILSAMLDEANSLDGIRTVKLPYGIIVTLPVERKFASIESIQAYVDKVLALPEVIEAYPNLPPCGVRARKGDSQAHYSPSKREIAIPDELGSWALRETVVLHELAHHLAYLDGHGARFRRAEIFLYGLCMSPEVGLAQQVLWAQAGLS